MRGADAVGIHVFADVQHFFCQKILLVFKVFVLGLKLFLEVSAVVANLDVNRSQIAYAAIFGGSSPLNFVVHTSSFVLW